MCSRRWFCRAPNKVSRNSWTTGLCPATPWRESFLNFVYYKILHRLETRVCDNSIVCALHFIQVLKKVVGVGKVWALTQDSL